MNEPCHGQCSKLTKHCSTAPRPRAHESISGVASLRRLAELRADRCCSSSTCHPSRSCRPPKSP
eukprot:15447866-Alexandrium_andersonii.AAC.1